MSRRRYRRSHPFRSFVLTLILVLAAGAAVLWFAGPLKHQAAKAVGTKVMETAADSIASQIAQASGGSISEEAARQQIQNGLDSMSAEDKETLTDIVENHMDGQTVADIAGQAADGNLQGAAQAAASELTPEEYEKLQELALKYLGQSLTP